MHRSSLRVWLGTALAITGLALLCSWNTIFEFTLRKQLALSPSSPLFEIWRKPPFALDTTAFMFNLTNPHQFFDKDFKPEFEELGPYYFLERSEKINIVWNDNYTVTYEIQRNFYYDEERSNGSMNDNITALNAAPLSGSYSSRYWSLLSTFPLSAAIRMLGKSVLITKTFREIVLEGYPDPLLTMSNVLPGMQGKGKVVDKVGLIYERNGSTYFDGVLNLGTGADDINKVGTVFNWNYENRTNFEGECGHLYGTPAELFPPFISRDTNLGIFIPEVCRPVTLEYLEDTEIMGIPGYRYFMGEKNLDNGTLYPENWCRCGGECLPSGVMNASSCLRDMPLFLSLPHFLFGDPYYRQQVKGVSPPDVEKHLFHMTVEPTTGIPLEVSFRLQMNLLLRDNPKISLYKDVPTILFPYLWLERRFSMPADMATIFKWVLMMPTIGICFSIVLILLGLVILAFAVLPSSQRNKYQDENRMLQNGKATKENLSNNQLQLEDNELFNSETKERIDNEEKIKESPPDVNRTTRL